MEQAFPPDSGLSDIIWNLEKFYRQPERRIQGLLLPVIAPRGLRGFRKALVREAPSLHADKSLDWTDAFMAAQMLAGELNRIYSFDRDFDQITRIHRVQP